MKKCQSKRCRVLKQKKKRFLKKKKKLEIKVLLGHIEEAILRLAIIYEELEGLLDPMKKKVLSTRS